MSKVKKIEKYLMSKISGNRLKHIYGVASTALLLKGFFELDLNSEDIIAVALGHDCAKWMSHEKMAGYIKKNNIELNSNERDAVQLWHGPIAAHIMEVKLNIKNKNTLYAVRNHTVANEEDCLLLKLLYVADYIEPFREIKKDFDFVEFSDFEKLFTKVRESKNSYIKKIKQARKDK